MLMTVVLRTATFNHNLALERLRYEKIFWAAHAYEQYAIAYLKNSAAPLHDVVILTPSIINGYQANIQLTPHNNRVEVIVQLSDGHTILQKIEFTYHYTLDHTGKQSNMRISHWILT